MLTERYVNDRLPDILLSQDEYRPFPVVDERAAWTSLPADLQKGQVKLGEEYLGFDWPSLPATRFMEYERTGNRSKYEHISFRRREALGSLVIAECIEGRGRFIDDIINGIWCICEESFWGVPAHNYIAGNPHAPLPDTANPVIDLFAGETAGLLAWTHYLLRPSLDAVSDIITDRIRRETKRRILDPFLERDDFWWMGFAGRSVNNWNPWCNSNCLTAALLLEEDATRRIEAVAKSMRSLDCFIDSYPADGGCDEGTSYWNRAGGSLFDCLELLYGASGGQINVYDEALIGEIGRYLYRTFISGDYYVNFADGGARVQIAANLVYRYGCRIGDPQLMALGSSAHRAQRSDPPAVGGSLLRRLPALFTYAEIDRHTAAPPYLRDVFLDSTGVMVAREQEGSDRGLYVAAKGGHNAESHNHNDVGHFIVYAGGNPVIVDVGVGTYTAKTFGPERYDIWTMQSAYHNLPTVNGVQQHPGRGFAASGLEYSMDDSYAEFSLNIDPAYPDDAGIKSWRRRVRLERQGKASVIVADSFVLEDASRDVVLSLMTPHRPDVSEGTIILSGPPVVRLEFDASKLVATFERIEVEDARLSGVWGEELFRILLSARCPVESDTWMLRIEQV